MHLIKSVAFVACSSLLATLATPTFAQTITPACAAADKKMMAMEKSLASMAPTGNVDKDFASMMAANAKMMMDAAKMEMACGKNPQTRQMAETIAKQNQDVLHNLQITSGSTH